MTDCPNGEIRDLLPDLLHDRLTGPSRAAVEAHVASCADCRAELSLLAQARATLRRTPALDLAAIVAAVPAPRAAARRPSRSSWRIAAAITAIAVGGTSVAIANRTPGPASPVAVATAVAPATPAPASAQPVVADPGAPAQPRAARVAVGTPAVADAQAPRELTLTGAVGDLSDRELAALLGDLRTLDAVPSGEVETTPLVALPPAPARGGDL